MNGKTNPPGQHTSDRWAKSVVSDLLRSKPPVYVRRGYLAATMHFASLLVPRRVFDWLFTMSSDLQKMKSRAALHEDKKDR